MGAAETIMGVKGGWLCRGTAGCFPFPLLLVTILENNKEEKEVEGARAKKKKTIDWVYYIQRGDS